MLILLDQILSATGVVILAVWAFRSRTRIGISHTIAAPCAIREDSMLPAMMAYSAVMLVLASVMNARVGESDPVLTSLVVNNGAQVCGLLACMALVAGKSPGGLRRFVLGPPDDSTRYRFSSGIQAILLCIVAIGVCPLIRDVVVWIISEWAPAYAPDPHPTLRALNDASLTSPRRIALWISAAVVAPLAEEFFFRGFLMNFVATVTRNTRVAVVVSALAFAAVHISTLYAIPALFFLGLLLGGAYMQTCRLWIPITIHMIFNLKTLVWEELMRLAG